MAITHTTASRNAWADAIVDRIDTGSAEDGGALVIGTAGMASTLVRIEFDDPAFGAATGGVATALGVPLEGTATATGTAAAFEIQDRDGTKVFEGTVGATGSGADLEMTNVSVTTNDVIRLASFTYTAGN